MTTTLIPGDDRKAVENLNYNGELKDIDPRRPLGPNTLGEWLWPVETEYDPQTNRTRLGLSFIAPPPADDEEAA